jgi:hypothetical protein
VDTISSSARTVVAEALDRLSGKSAADEAAGGVGVETKHKEEGEVMLCIRLSASEVVGGRVRTVYQKASKHCTRVSFRGCSHAGSLPVA